MDNVRFIRPEDELNKKIKAIKLNGHIFNEAIHYLDLERKYAVVWDNQIYYSSKFDKMRLVQGEFEIVWKEDNLEN